MVNGIMCSPQKVVYGNIKANAGIIFRNKLWFSAIDRNGLFYYDLVKKKTEFVMLFPREDLDSSFIHWKCLLYNSCIFFFPKYGENIHIFELESNKMKTLHFTEKVLESCISGDYIWLFCSDSRKHLFKMNLSTYEIEYVEDFFAESNRLFGNNSILLSRVVTIGDHLVFGILGTNTIGVWDATNSRLKTIQTDIDDIFSVMVSDGNYWVVDRHSSYVYRLDEKQRVLKISVDNDLSYHETESMIRRFYNNILHINGFIVVLPAFGNSVVIIGDDIKTIRLKDRGQFVNGVPKMRDYLVDNENIYVLPSGCGTDGYIIDVLNCNVKDLIFNECKDYFVCYCKYKLFKKDIVVENSKCGLSEYMLGL